MLPLRRFPFFISVLGIVARFFLVSGYCLPDHVHAQTADSSGATQPLDVKTGFWEVNEHTVLSSDSEQVLQIYAQMAAQLPPDQRAAYLANVKAQLRAQAAKGTDKKRNSCLTAKNLEKGDVLGYEWSNPDSSCSRQSTSSSQKLAGHITCQDRLETYQLEPVDSEHIKGSVEVSMKDADHTRIKITFLAAWVRENCVLTKEQILQQRLASGLGNPRGPEEVTKFYPDRVVAMIDGKQITAQQALNMIKFFPGRRQYESRLPELVQHCYMLDRIAEEATARHLDQLSPWKEQIQEARDNILNSWKNAVVSGRMQDIPPAVHWQLKTGRASILWQAYFNQGSTKEEKRALIKQEMDTYKIQVRDPDFFNGVTNSSAAPSVQKPAPPQPSQP